MLRVEHNSELNRIVVDLGQSLLQFVGEVSPWSPANAAAARDTVARVVKEQREHVDRIAELLVDRDHAVDFGTYPAEYTDLHFLSLKSLVPRVIANQDSILTELTDLVHTCIDDAEAHDVLSSVLSGERQIADALKSIKL